MRAVIEGLKKNKKYKYFYQSQFITEFILSVKFWHIISAPRVLHYGTTLFYFTIRHFQTFSKCFPIVTIFVHHRENVTKGLSKDFQPCGSIKIDLRHP